MTFYNYDRDLADDDIADLKAEARWERQRHGRLMSLPPGHPDEPDDEDESVDSAEE